MSRGSGAGERGAEPPPVQTKGVSQCVLRDVLGLYEDREVQQVLEEHREGVTSPSCLALVLSFPNSDGGTQPAGWGGIPAGPQQSQLRAVLRNSSTTRRALCLPWLCPPPGKVPVGSHRPPADPTCLWPPTS